MAEVEGLLEHDGGALARWQHGQGSLGRVAQLGVERGACRGLPCGQLLGAPPALGPGAPQLVDPQVGEDAEQVGARMAHRLVAHAERREGPQQGVVHQILGVEGVARQPLAVSEQIRAKGLHLVDEARPAVTHAFLQPVDRRLRHWMPPAGSMSGLQPRRIGRQERYMAVDAPRATTR